MKEFYTVKGLAALLEVDPKTIYRMVGRHQLKAHKIGYLIRFRRSDVQAYLRRCPPHKKQPDIAEKTANSFESRPRGDQLKKLKELSEIHGVPLEELIRRWKKQQKEIRDAIMSL